MNKVLDFQIDAIDFDATVDEIDVIIPKYLESIEQLEGSEDFVQMEANLKSVIAYWECLSRTFSHLEPFSEEVPFESIIKNTLQTELATLERVYLRINMSIEFSKASWSKELWVCAEKVLERMDSLLERLGFESNHRDRLFIKELQGRNMKKFHWWQLKDRLKK